MNTETVYSGRSEADLVMASTGKVAGEAIQVTGNPTYQASGIQRIQVVSCSAAQLQTLLREMIQILFGLHMTRMPLEKLKKNHARFLCFTVDGINSGKIQV